MRRRQIALAFSITGGHHEAVLQGIVDYVEKHDPWTFLTAPETYDMSVLGLEGWPGDGVIANIFSPEESRAAQGLGIPVVNLSAMLADAGLPRVVNDQRAIGRLGAEHLLQRQIQRFAYYGVKKAWYTYERGEGFRQRLNEAGYSSSVLESPRALAKRRNWRNWFEELRQWLQTMERPFGVMAANDVRARMVIDACRQLGLHVPHDVAVIGVDNDHFICEVSHPKLTSIARNGRQIGYKAAELLDRLMSGRRPRKRDLIIPPAGVVARQSTDMVPVDNPDLNRAVQYIRDHVDRPFAIAELLRHVPVSRRWLEYRFRERFGHTPHEYICETRVERAKQMLAESTKLRLPQIAKACGFSNSDSLRLIFRRFTGMTPSEYRKSIAKQP